MNTMLEGKPLQEKDGVYYFIEVPKDYTPLPETIKDKGEWSDSRKTDFKYYTDVLQHHDRNGVLVDLGSGFGQFSELFDQFQTINIDIFPYQKVDIVADFTKKIPLRDGVADIVVLSNVLEHTPDPWILLREAYRVLKPGGILIGSVPFMAHVHMEPYDFLRYTYVMLENMFDDTGFSDRKVSGLEEPFMMKEWCDKMFYSTALKQTHLTKNQRRAIRLGRYFNNLVNRVFKPTYELLKINPKFTRRYGFIARKGGE